MRHSLIRRKALLLDHFIDVYKRARKRRSFPHREVAVLVRLLFPGAEISGRGAFKTVHKISSRERDLVLKTSATRNLRNEERVYRRIPPTLRNRYFAKIYWRTKYCLLQKYGTPGKIPATRFEKLRTIGKQCGLTDVRPANIRSIGGIFKIIDANLSRRRN